MKKIILIASCFLLSINTFAQIKKVKGNGNVTSKDRNVEKFSKVIIDGDIDVTLVNSPFQKKITIAGDANLHQIISSEITNGTLTLKLKDNFEIIKKTDHFKITLTNKDLEEITVNGSANLETVGINEVEKLTIQNNGIGKITLNVKTDDLRVYNTGSGSITTEGKSNLVNTKNSGSGTINLGNVSTFFAEIHNTGSGDIYSNSVNGIDGTLTGSGNIYYKNTKTVNIDVSGSGKVIREQ